EIFKLVHIKGDLGALMLGMMIASTPKANELYKSLIGFKDLFLIGFFLLIGFSALPTWELFGWALLLVALLPVKMLLYFAIFLAFGLRGRTAMLSSLALMNFSEFGLIVAKYSVDQEWMSPETLVVLAMAVSISFAASSLLYNYAHQIYTRLKDQVCRFERKSVHNQTGYERPTNAEVLIVGMGRVGSGAY
ncbi:MAG: cation:proton antiporter, partial [Pseudomonadales bacterium]